MTWNTPGTVLLTNADPRVGNLAYLGDPENPPDVAASFISLFDPNRGSTPIALSIPWLTALVDNGQGDSQFNLELFNVSSVTYDNLVSVDSNWQLGCQETNHYSLFFPALTSFDGALYDQNSTLASVDFPVLTSFGGTAVLGSNFLTNFNAPNLSTISGVLELTPNGGLITDLSNFAGVRVISGELQVTSQAALADLSGIYNVSQVTGVLDFSYNTLSVSQVNALLVALAASLSASSSGGSLYLQGQTPAASPSGAGAAAVTTLQGYGITLVTD